MASLWLWNGTWWMNGGTQTASLPCSYDEWVCAGHKDWLASPSHQMALLIASSEWPVPGDCPLLVFRGDDGKQSHRYLMAPDCLNKHLVLAWCRANAGQPWPDIRAAQTVNWVWEWPCAPSGIPNAMGRSQHQRPKTDINNSKHVPPKYPIQSMSHQSIQTSNWH